MIRHASFLSALIAVAAVSTASAAESPSGLDKQGQPGLKFAGPMAFGPDAILFIGDPLSAAVFAIETADRSAADAGAIDVPAINQQVAAVLRLVARSGADQRPGGQSPFGRRYLRERLSRGGPDATPVILPSADGKPAVVSLDDVRYAKAPLPNAPDPSAKDRRGNSQRQESITDLAYVDGRVVVAGLSNEEFSSNLRTIPFPFTDTDTGTSIEIFHGAR